MLELENYNELLASPDLVDTLTQLFFYEERKQHADFSIVLGMNLWRRPISVAVEMYHDGLSGKLVLCGGFNNKINKTEAFEMYDFALAAGIPEQDILVDSKSLNTFENITNAYQLIKTDTPNLSTLRLNVVSIHFHAKRALLTSCKCFDAVKQIESVSYPSLYYDSSNWFESEVGIRNVFTELEKLSIYFPHAIPSELLKLTNS